MAITTLLAAATVVVVGATHGALLNGLAYVISPGMSVVIIDVFFLLRPLPNEPLPVRYPRMELLVAAVLYVVAGSCLTANAAGSHSHSRLLAIVALLSIFPIALTLFLLICGYRPRELGIRWRGFGPVPLIMICSGVVMALSLPVTLIWRQFYHEMGSVWAIIKIGVFVAALPEEFLRMVWQSRIGACLSNRAVGWLAATLFWAALHAPLWGQAMSLTTLLSLVRIIPYGLLLGYLTFRTQSIFPSVLLHATKFLWGGV